MDKQQDFLDLLQQYLSTHKEVAKTIEKIRENPEILEVLLAELNAAISEFNRLKNENLIKNTQKLMGILESDNLPETAIVFTDILKGKNAEKRLKKLFAEMNRFKFLDDKTSEINLLGRILIALYRTYLLQNMSELRKKGAQVASSLEEMLALMALAGFDTHLFTATKHWILDWRKEGFSKELAEKLKRIKY
jgi:hypothetical protein